MAPKPALQRCCACFRKCCACSEHWKGALCMLTAHCICLLACTCSSQLYGTPCTDNDGSNG